ncbi:MAG: hypothetical protein H7Z73_11390 [Candidatus Saccharibacteria bacterium]|nr:hypothetical protein [Moraxellaceae bacterium]
MIQPIQLRSSHDFLRVAYSRLVSSGLHWHGALLGTAIVLCSLCNPVLADDALPAPSNLEDAKSDVLQLDRDLAHLKQRLLLPQRTQLLFGLTPKSKLTVNTIQISLDGRVLPDRQYDQVALDALLKGGSDTVMDANLSVGIHVLDVTVLQNNHEKITQRIEFKKTVPKDILGIQLIERPGVGELPLKLVEWSQHD